jgi:hypothetical protein
MALARRRAAALLLALCCAAALCAAAQDGDAAAQGSAGGVTWLVQLSDLHLSAHAWPERCAQQQQRSGPACARLTSSPVRALGSATWSRLARACCAACALFTRTMSSIQAA